MTLIRSMLSAFILLLLISVVAGWRWTAAHQAPAQAGASHLVLAASAFAGICGLVVIWSRHRA
jgi:hypothetical protein